MEQVIRTRGLTKDYGSVLALDDLSLDIGPGITGLVGSGRSELLETIFGARRAHGGRVTVDGKALRPGSVPAAVKAGRIKYREDVVEGLDNAPQAFIGLLKGKNFGKLVVRVAK